MWMEESPGRVSEGTEPDDPLLKSGSFIDPSKSADPETPVPGSPNNLGDTSSNGPDVAADYTPDGVINSPATDNMGPTWLPKGWTVEDRYYCDPVSKHVFRSKNEVLHYVQTGTRLKRKRNADNPVGEADEECLFPDADLSRGRKQKRAAAPASPKLDFDNVPTVTWVVKDRTQDSWVPHMDGCEVTKSVQHQWSATFSWITSKSQ